MLQQTQTKRVASKFQSFITKFSTLNSLAKASLKEVLGVWQGLGYNKRAQALWKNAQTLVEMYNAIIPSNPKVLQTLQHIGPNTAASIVAFAFNIPTVFIETNIRTVFLHSFFKHEEEINDKELVPLIEQTVDLNNPREWYYALMDYGVLLKKNLPNPSRKSAHHTKQSNFQGSDRQIRGNILKILLHKGRISMPELFKNLGDEHQRYKRILSQLVKESMVTSKNGFFWI